MLSKFFLPTPSCCISLCHRLILCFVFAVSGFVISLCLLSCSLISLPLNLSQSFSPSFTVSLPVSLSLCLINMHYFTSTTVWVFQESLKKTRKKHSREEGCVFFVMTSQRLWYPWQLHVEKKALWDFDVGGAYVSNPAHSHLTQGTVSLSLLSWKKLKNACV